MLKALVARTDRDPRLLAERFHFRLLSYGTENGIFWAHVEATSEVIELWRRDPDGGLLGVFPEEDAQVPGWCRHPPGPRQAQAPMPHG